MRDLKNKLTSSKNTKNIQTRKGKSFGYQVLGFGAGGGVNPFITATGGTIATSGNFKTHIFTGPGSFVVCTAAVCSADNVVEYLVVAGGASAGTRIGGGGGAGGARVFETSPLKSPIVAPAGITVSATTYPIAVGGGGTGQPYPSPAVGCSSGSNSTALGLTASGGGRGGTWDTIGSAAGGSGGGGTGYDGNISGGGGNSPPVSPAQGTAGGGGFGNSCGPGSPGGFNLGGGGGGAEGAGTGAAPGAQAGPGGRGMRLSDVFVGPTAPSYGTPFTPGAAPGTRFFAGGGGAKPNGAAPQGGGGGSGNEPTPSGRQGTDNTGGGGGAGDGTPGVNGVSGAGGSGIVMIRYKFKQKIIWHILQKFQKQTKYFKY